MPCLRFTLTKKSTSLGGNLTHPLSPPPCVRWRIRPVPRSTGTSTSFLPSPPSWRVGDDPTRRDLRRHLAARDAGRDGLTDCRWWQVVADSRICTTSPLPATADDPINVAKSTAIIPQKTLYNLAEQSCFHAKRSLSHFSSQ